MKGRTQTILILTTVVVVSALLLLFPLNNSSLLFISIALFSALLIFLTSNWLLMRRIKNLKQQLSTKLAKNGTQERLDIKGDDDITKITEHINELFAIIRTHQATLEQYTVAETQRFKKQNLVLEQELSQRIAIEKKLREDRETLSQLAHYDSVTALPNRVFFNEILNKSMNHAKRRNRICATLLIDLDSFTHINEKFGHEFGDYVLKEMGNRFVNTLRSEDILAKLDADEFIILLNDIGKPKFASSVAEKILNVCAQPFKIDSLEFSLTASIGICIYPHDASSLEELLKNVDIALDKAKKRGGNAYQFYKHDLDIEAREFIRLDKALRSALKNNEMSLYYQPKMHIKNGKIRGIEALIRWFHPTLGPIEPTQFIALAEEIGMIMPIGEWALREACRMNKFWQDEGYEHMTIAINLSPKQFHHPDMVNIIRTILKETQLNPQYLELEINETTMMDNIPQAMQILNAMKAIGVEISIDHFGTGYSSIRQLKQFPISILKIDKNFIKGLPHNPNDVAITNAFISLAHHLGLEVVAEGVETAEQVQYLALQNCDMVQGYYLSHPLPAQKIVGQFKKLAEKVII